MYMFAFGLENGKAILFVVPVAQFTSEFRQANNIGMSWDKRFDSLQSALGDVDLFNYDDMRIVE